MDLRSNARNRPNPRAIETILGGSSAPTSSSNASGATSTKQSQRQSLNRASKANALAPQSNKNIVYNQQKSLQNKSTVKAVQGPMTPQDKLLSRKMGLKSEVKGLVSAQQEGLGNRKKIGQISRNSEVHQHGLPPQTALNFNLPQNGTQQQTTTSHYDQISQRSSKEFFLHKRGQEGLTKNINALKHHGSRSRKASNSNEPTNSLRSTNKLTYEQLARKGAAEIMATGVSGVDEADIDQLIDDTGNVSDMRFDSSLISDNERASQNFSYYGRRFQQATQHTSKNLGELSPTPQAETIKKAKISLQPETFAESEQKCSNPFLKTEEQVNRRTQIKQAYGTINVGKYDTSKETVDNSSLPEEHMKQKAAKYALEQQMNSNLMRQFQGMIYEPADSSSVGIPTGATSMQYNNHQMPQNASSEFSYGIDQQNRQDESHDLRSSRTSATVNRTFEVFNERKSLAERQEGLKVRQRQSSALPASSKRVQSSKRSLAAPKVTEYNRQQMTKTSQNFMQQRQETRTSQHRPKMQTNLLSGSGLALSPNLNQLSPQILSKKGQDFHFKHHKQQQQMASSLTSAPQGATTMNCNDQNLAQSHHHLDGNLYYGGPRINQKQNASVNNEGVQEEVLYRKGARSISRRRDLGGTQGVIQARQAQVQQKGKNREISHEKNLESASKLKNIPKKQKLSRVSSAKKSLRQSGSNFNVVTTSQRRLENQKATGKVQMSCQACMKKDIEGHNHEVSAELALKLVKFNRNYKKSGQCKLHNLVQCDVCSRPSSQGSSTTHNDSGLLSAGLLKRFKPATLSDLSKNNVQKALGTKSSVKKQKPQNLRVLNREDSSLNHKRNHSNQKVKSLTREVNNDADVQLRQQNTVKNAEMKQIKGQLNQFRNRGNRPSSKILPKQQSFAISEVKLLMASKRAGDNTSTTNGSDDSRGRQLSENNRIASRHVLQDLAAKKRGISQHKMPPRLLSAKTQFVGHSAGNNSYNNNQRQTPTYINKSDHENLLDNEIKAMAEEWGRADPHDENFWKQLQGQAREVSEGRKTALRGTQMTQKQLNVLDQQNHVFKKLRVGQDPATIEQNDPEPPKIIKMTDKASKVLKSENSSLILDRTLQGDEPIETEIDANESHYQHMASNPYMNNANSLPQSNQQSSQNQFRTSLAVANRFLAKDQSAGVLTDYSIVDEVGQFKESAKFRQLDFRNPNQQDVPLDDHNITESQRLLKLQQQHQMSQQNLSNQIVEVASSKRQDETTSTSPNQHHLQALEIKSDQAMMIEELDSAQKPPLQSNLQVQDARKQKSSPTDQDDSEPLPPNQCEKISQQHNLAKKIFPEQDRSANVGENDGIDAQQLMDDIEAAVDEDSEVCQEDEVEQGKDQQDREENEQDQEQDQVIEEGSSEEKDSLEETDKKTVGRVTMYDEWLALNSHKDDQNDTSDYLNQNNGDIPRLNIDKTTAIEQERKAKNQTHCYLGTDEKASDLIANVRASKDDYHSIVSSTENFQRAPLPERPKTRELKISLQNGQHKTEDFIGENVFKNIPSDLAPQGETTKIEDDFQTSHFQEKNYSSQKQHNEDKSDIGKSAEDLQIIAPQKMANYNSALATTMVQTNQDVKQRPQVMSFGGGDRSEFGKSKASMSFLDGGPSSLKDNDLDISTSMVEIGSTKNQSAKGFSNLNPFSSANQLKQHDAPPIVEEDYSSLKSFSQFTEEIQVNKSQSEQLDDNQMAQVKQTQAKMSKIAQGFVKKGENLPPKSPVLLQNKVAKIGNRMHKDESEHHTFGEQEEEDGRSTQREIIKEQIGGKIISNVRDFLAFEDSDDEIYGPTGVQITGSYTNEEPEKSQKSLKNLPNNLNKNAKVAQIQQSQQNGLIKNQKATGQENLNNLNQSDILSQNKVSLTPPFEGQNLTLSQKVQASQIFSESSRNVDLRKTTQATGVPQLKDEQLNGEAAIQENKLNLAKESEIVDKQIEKIDYNVSNEGMSASFYRHQDQLMNAQAERQNEFDKSVKTNQEQFQTVKKENQIYQDKVTDNQNLRKSQVVDRVRPPTGKKRENGGVPPKPQNYQRPSGIKKMLTKKASGQDLVKSDLNPLSRMNSQNMSLTNINSSINVTPRGTQKDEKETYKLANHEKRLSRKLSGVQLRNASNGSRLSSRQDIQTSTLNNNGNEDTLSSGSKRKDFFEKHKSSLAPDALKMRAKQHGKREGSEQSRQASRDRLYNQQTIASMLKKNPELGYNTKQKPLPLPPAKKPIKRRKNAPPPFIQPVPPLPKEESPEECDPNEPPALQLPIEPSPPQTFLAIPNDPPQKMRLPEDPPQEPMPVIVPNICCPFEPDIPYEMNQQEPIGENPIPFEPMPLYLSIPVEPKDPEKPEKMPKVGNLIEEQFSEKPEESEIMFKLDEPEPDEFQLLYPPKACEMFVLPPQSPDLCEEPNLQLLKEPQLTLALEDVCPICSSEPEQNFMSQTSFRLSNEKGVKMDTNQKENLDDQNDEEMMEEIRETDKEQEESKADQESSIPIQTSTNLSNQDNISCHFTEESNKRTVGIQTSQHHFLKVSQSQEYLQEQKAREMSIDWAHSSLYDEINFSKEKRTLGGRKMMSSGQDKLAQFENCGNQVESKQILLETQKKVLSQIECEYNVDQLKRKVQGKDQITDEKLSELYRNGLNTLQALMYMLRLEKEWEFVIRDQYTGVLVDSAEASTSSTSVLPEDTIKLLTRCRKMYEARALVQRLLKMIIQRDQLVQESVMGSKQYPLQMNEVQKVQTNKTREFASNSNAIGGTTLDINLGQFKGTKQIISQQSASSNLNKETFAQIKRLSSRICSQINTLTEEHRIFKRPFIVKGQEYLEQISEETKRLENELTQNTNY